MTQNYNSVKTIYGIALEASRRPGNTFTAIPYSTINEELGFEHGTALPENAQPEIEYLAIGRGGHRNVVGAGNLTDNLEHRINNACLFEHIPFIMRRTNDDLTAIQRAKYRGRKLVQKDGLDYYAYYLMKLTIAQGDPVIEKITILDGQQTRENYVPTADQLNPQPVTMTNNKVNRATNVHFNVSTPLSFSLTPTDIQEIMNCIDIIYGNPQYGVISEIGICSGVDKSVTSTLGGNTVTYDEVLATQIFNFIGTSYTLSAQSSGQNFDFRLGSTLPYYS